MFKAFIAFLFLILSGPLAASAQLAGKHVYILHPGMESVWGSYMMVVENSTPGEKVQTSFDLMLPESTADWSPQQGIEKSDISLKEDGGLHVSAEFIRPQTLIVMGFKMAGAANGEAQLKVTVPFPMEEFSIMALAGQLTMQSDDFEYKGPIDFSGQKYDTWVASNKDAGDVVTSTISGLPQGRQTYWMLSGIFAALLVLAIFILTQKTKPVQNNSDFEIVNA